MFVIGVYAENVFGYVKDHDVVPVLVSKMGRLRQERVVYVEKMLKTGGLCQKWTVYVENGSIAREKKANHVENLNGSLASRMRCLC